MEHIKVFIKTFGCRVNQVESQAMREQFALRRADFVDKFEDADICLLNTCTVTAKADSDVEKLMRMVVSRNPAARLIVTGCYAAAHEDKIKEKFPHAEIINKYDIGRVIFELPAFEWTISGNEGKSRAFVKIQDGCDAFCSYCIVPYARNKKVSKPVKDVVEEIKQIIDKGFKEIVLTGINIGNYECPQTKAKLADLLPKIYEIPGQYRIRFSSIELNTLTDELIAAAKAGGERFCNYFHIPLQSGSDTVLSDMNRHYTTMQYAKRIFDLRAVFPGIGIYADVIAGYPTETEENFEQAYNFINKLELSGLHVFSYSPRPLTRAASLPQLPQAVITQRAQKLRALDAQLRSAFAAKQINQTLEVLAENCKNGTGTGVAGNFVRVNFKSLGKEGSLLKIKILSSKEAICEGEEVL
ncbi:threonylcarbamoyladenosine tRNA methylthiotransferase MtaB [Elusimicrobium posterum]|uniref:tRNA (N(6)-L-threonylcarbamoyladenosine(37)-C(2))- methylthiotransferase MtaB n=1 Tax=Elusimicrobium posterum TaxID=3116653 RepID=UPI003C75F56E